MKLLLPISWEHKPGELMSEEGFSNENKERPPLLKMAYINFCMCSYLLMCSYPGMSTRYQFCGTRFFCRPVGGRTWGGGSWQDVAQTLGRIKIAPISLQGHDPGNHTAAFPLPLSLKGPLLPLHDLGNCNPPV